MRRRLADRRAKPRFDIVGDLRGALEVFLRLDLQNVSPGGALFQGSSALLPDSVYRLVVSLGSGEFTAEVKVRHVREVASSNGARSFLIGVEFLTVHPLLMTQLAQLARAADGTTMGVYGA